MTILYYYQASELYDKLMGNWSVSSKDIDIALECDNFWWLRNAAAMNPNATKEQLDKALDDNHHFVRAAAATNPSTDPVSVAYYKMKYLDI